jgi:3-oxoacyl-[acyl-carrier-protein] synthase III
MFQRRIAAVAAYLPERVVTNQELISSYGVPHSADWLQETTGAAERRFAGVAETTLSMAAAVLRELIEMGRLRDPCVDVLIMTSDDGEGGDAGGAEFAACMAGLVPALTIDLSPAQGGFTAAVEAANRHLDRGCRRVLIVASEVRSRRLRAGQPWGNHQITEILGDGATGVLLERVDGLGAEVSPRCAEPPPSRGSAPCFAAAHANRG